MIDKSTELGEKIPYMVKDSEVLPQVSRDIEDIVFSARKGIRQYEIIKASQRILDQWKVEVDEFISAIIDKDVLLLEEMLMNEGRSTGDNRTVCKLLQEEHLEVTDIILMAIGLFVLRNKSPWDRNKSGLKVLKGGRLKMESIFEPDGWANCYDVAVTVREIARLYNIEGNVHGRGLLHAYFETIEGKISDPMYGWRRGGLFQTKSAYTKFKKEMGLLRQFGLKR